MPGYPFSNPTSVDELYRNIIADIGITPQYPPSEFKTLLQLLDYGLFAQGSSVYGDGSDGTIIFDGTTTVLGLAPSSSVYTLTRDIWLSNGSTVNSGVTIATAGFRIFCQGQFINNGTIRDNGNAGAASGTAGTALSAAGTTQRTSLAGGAGATGAGTAASNGSGNLQLGGAGAAGSGTVVSSGAGQTGVPGKLVLLPQ